MRIIDLLQDHTLSKKNVLEKLICHHLCLTKAELFSQSDRELAPEDVDYITTGYHAYANDLKPLEYIIGKVAFLGVSFKVSPATLIPRPETEYMIEAVNEFLSQQATPTALIDVGTGCGVLGLSVLYHNPDKISELVLTELSKEALEVARENYERLFQSSSDATNDEPKFLPYNSSLKEKARELRKNMTKAEKKLWYEFFKQHPLFEKKSTHTPLAKGGNSERSEEWGDISIRVLRQRPIDSYIVDFYIPAAKLVIEIDGDTHNEETVDYDQQRTQKLASYGLTVLRFTNQELLDNFSAVCEKIVEQITNKSPLTPLTKGGTKKPLFLQTNLLDHSEVTTFFETDEHITLVANLPYIPDQMFDDNVEDNVKKREPRMAFVGGDDGLDLYREMFDQLENIEHNNDLTLFLEMMTRQIDILRKEYEKAFTFEEVKTFHFNIRIVRVGRK